MKEFGGGVRPGGARREVQAGKSPHRLGLQMERSEMSHPEPNKPPHRTPQVPAQVRRGSLLQAEPQLHGCVALGLEPVLVQYAITTVLVWAGLTIERKAYAKFVDRLPPRAGGSYPPAKVPSRPRRQRVCRIPATP